MTSQTTVTDSLAVGIVDRVESLIREAERATKPLEVEPFRGQLFELFVTAEAAGLLEPDSEPDLSADGLCHALAQRWRLGDSARESIQRQEKLSADQLAKMRMLWSVMRMWMEWAYAWQRWPEFRGPEA